MARISYGQKIETITVALVIPIQRSLADHRQLYSEEGSGPADSVSGPELMKWARVLAYIAGQWTKSCF
jgi:hypothetical protein